MFPYYPNHSILGALGWARIHVDIPDVEKYIYYGVHVLWSIQKTIRAAIKGKP